MLSGAWTPPAPVERRAAPPFVANDAGPKFKSAASEFLRARKAETHFAAQLRKVARHIEDIVRAFNPNDPFDMQRLQTALRRYSATIEPWARSVAAKMITEVAARDKIAWRRVSAQMGKKLRQEIATAPTGQAMQQLLGEQVSLIASLPTEAAQRVHDLTLEAVTEGGRAKDIVGEIMRTGEVTRSRANLIARTETARTSAVLTQVRAQHVGSTHFEWLTAGDSDVRHDHKILNHKIFAWDDPPIADRRTGIKALPGSIWNCRCIAIPQIPSDD